MLGEGYYLVVQQLVHDITEILEKGHHEAVTYVFRDQPKRRLLKMTPQIPTMTMIYRRNRKSVISAAIISYLIHAYRVINHLSVYTDFLSCRLSECPFLVDSLLTLIFYLICQISIGSALLWACWRWSGGLFSGCRYLKNTPSPRCFKHLPTSLSICSFHHPLVLI